MLIYIRVRFGSRGWQSSWTVVESVLVPGPDELWNWIRRHPERLASNPSSAVAGPPRGLPVISRQMDGTPGKLSL